MFSGRGSRVQHCRGVCHLPSSLNAHGREDRRCLGDFTLAGAEAGLTFDVVFAVFAAAMVVIAVFVARWAVGIGREARRLKDEANDSGGTDS